MNSQKNKSRKDILVLETSLFPDRQTIENAVSAMEEDCNITRVKIKPDEMNESAWADVLEAIMKTGMVLVL